MRGRKVAGFIIGAAAFIVFSLWSGIASAACTVTTTSVNFGSYDVFLTTATDVNGSVSVTCTDPGRTRVTIAIGQSPNSGGFDPRQMKHSTLPDLLDYNLYKNRKRTRIWGDGTGGTFTVTRRVRQNRTVTRNIYARITPAQDVSAGSYFDTLTVTITW
ncbi:MAG: hypothetical protein BMS9Abin23_0469 [Thermodesulfobacteriota bacterium]|nr:MAG: hypothetical protein BMS9Abin23_0469 [Thermodesulfobacteriota bacterium]